MGNVVHLTLTPQESKRLKEMEMWGKRISDTELAQMEIIENGQFDETGGTLGDADFDDARTLAAAADRPELSDS